MRNLRELHAANAFMRLEDRTLASISYGVSFAYGGVGPALAVADFDRDGDRDVIASPSVSDGNAAAFRMWHNDGTGALILDGGVAPPPNSSPATSIVAADFDNDMDIDLVVSGLTADGLYVYYNNGSGAFSAGQLIGGTANVLGVTAIDVNADGRSDLIATTSDSRVKSFLSTGPSFTQVGDIAMPWVGGAGQLIRSADMNGDRRLDFVVTAVTPPGPAQVWLGNALGGLDLSATVQMYHPIASDLNGDGRLDLVGGSDATIAVALGRGDGTFESPFSIGSTFSDAGPVEVTYAFDADNADGPDLLITENRVNGTGTQTVTRLWLNDGSDRFPQAGPNMPSITAVANLGGDARPEVLRVEEVSPGASTPTRLRVLFAGAGPSVGSVTLPSEQMLPGRTYTVDINNVLFSAGATPGTGHVRLYADSAGNGAPGNGVFNEGVDVLLSEAVLVGGGNLQWRATFRLADGQVSPGIRRFFAVASDDLSASTPGTQDGEVWTRIFFPEGFRNDASVNEYVSIGNANTTATTYRVVAHYETGERDQTVTSGSIPATSRGGFTTVEHGSVNILRSNVGYSLELLSNAPLAATFAHYDNFGVTPQASTATGEEFSSTTSAQWGFADLSTRTFDYLLYFNPTDADITATVTFYNDIGGSFAVPVTIPALRRGGLSLRDIPQLAANTSFSAYMTSDLPIMASMTRYDPAAGAGFAALGFPTAADPASSVASSIPGLDVRTPSATSIRLFNPNGSTNSVTVIWRFDTGLPEVSRTFAVQPFATMTVTAADVTPVGATTASVRIRSDLKCIANASSADAARSDSIGASPSITAATAWGIGDAFMSTAGAGATLFENLSIYNDSDTLAAQVQVRYLFTNGTFADRTLTVSARGTTTLRMEQETAIQNHAANTWFSIVVTSTIGIFVNFTHWDLAQGGGWSSNGTPLPGAFVPGP